MRDARFRATRVPLFGLIDLFSYGATAALHNAIAFDFARGPGARHVPVRFDSHGSGRVNVMYAGRASALARVGRSADSCCGGATDEAKSWALVEQYQEW